MKADVLSTAAAHGGTPAKSKGPLAGLFDFVQAHRAEMKTLLREHNHVGWIVCDEGSLDPARWDADTGTLGLHLGGSILRRRVWVESGRSDAHSIAAALDARSDLGPNRKFVAIPLVDWAKRREAALERIIAAKMSRSMELAR